MTDSESMRRAVRRWVRLEGEIVRVRDFMRIGGRILDLSEFGARVESDARVLTGEILILSFEMPGVGTIDTEATVAHVVHNEDGRVTLGLEFIQVDPEMHASLRDRLHKLPPIIPSGPYVEARWSMIPAAV